MKCNDNNNNTIIYITHFIPYICSKVLKGLLFSIKKVKAIYFSAFLSHMNRCLNKIDVIFL